jgi:hypothetical protein
MTAEIRVLALGNGVLRNALAGRDEGGEHVEHGLSAIIAKRFDGYSLSFRYEACESIEKLRVALADPSGGDTFGLDGFSPDVVVLAVAGDVVGFPQRAAEPNLATVAFHEDLVAVVDAVKERSGAHILVSNVSTFDPEDLTSNLHGCDPEPLSIRAHRIDLALLKLSHLLGVSLIDVDRVTAEAGCRTVVPRALELSAEGSALVRDETVRVLEDYGFFDPRPVVAQVGNRGGQR